jgi:hypothetical protein
MIAKLSGNTAPPAPWITRHAISEPMFHAKIPPIEPSRKIPRLITSSRSLPYWSPSLPSSGVNTDALSRNAVSSQVAQPVVVSRSSRRAGRAGMTSVCWSAKAIPAVTSAPSVML